MKKGDSVIILNNIFEERKKYNFSGANAKLKESIGKVFIIRTHIEEISSMYKNYVYLENDELRWVCIPLTAIKLLTEYRKEKINKLLNKIKL